MNWGKAAQPSIREQEAWWSEWNLRNRVQGADTDEFCREVARYVVDYLRRLSPLPGSLLEVGCGTGWLSSAIKGEFVGMNVAGVDLAPEAVASARSRNPGCVFLCGDFLGMEKSDLLRAASGVGYDVVVSVDAVAHVADQPAFIRRCRDLLAPGGRLLLFTQNPFVWHRTSWLPEQGEGQLRDWPSLKKLRRLLVSQGFSVEREASLIPQGDRGILRLRRYVQFGLKLLVGPALSRRAQERAMLGRTLIVEARR